MSHIRILPEVPLNEKRLERDIGEEMFLEIILKKNTLLLEGILESFEPNLIVSLENCTVIGPDYQCRCAGIMKTPFIWKQMGIKTIAEEAEKNPERPDFRGIIYKNDMIVGNLNNTSSCNVYRMIKLFLDQGMTIDEFREFKKKMEKQEMEISSLSGAFIRGKTHKKESG